MAFQNVFEKYRPTPTTLRAGTAALEVEADIVGMGVSAAYRVEHGKMEFHPGVEVEVITGGEGVVERSGRADGAAIEQRAEEKPRWDCRPR